MQYNDGKALSIDHSQVLNVIECYCNHFKLFMDPVRPPEHMEEWGPIISLKYKDALN